MKTEPTAAAIRAANVIRDAGVRGGSWIAKCIDDETGLPDLLAACEAAERILDTYQLFHDDGTDCTQEGTPIWEQLRAALAKVRGE